MFADSKISNDFRLNYMSRIQDFFRVINDERMYSITKAITMQVYLLFVVILLSCKFGKYNNDAPYYLVYLLGYLGH